MVPLTRHSAVLLATTRRESVHGGSSVASMPPAVSANNAADRLAPCEGRVE